MWLHCKEFGRLSNTGGLISVAFPSPQTHVLVAGMQEDEKRFLAELERDPEATFVLFPSEDSITAQQFMELVEDAPDYGEARAEEAEEVAPTSAPGERVYTIILVDGTWQQARRLAAKIPPHIKRVRLMPREAIDPLYKSPMRSQATPDRVCSLSAYVLLLQELQTPPQVCDYLFHLLHKKSDIVLNTSGKAWKQTGEPPPCARSLVNRSLSPELRQTIPSGADSSSRVADGLHETPKRKPPRNRKKGAAANSGPAPGGSSGGGEDGCALVDVETVTGEGQGEEGARNALGEMST